MKRPVILNILSLMVAFLLMSCSSTPRVAPQTASSHAHSNSGVSQAREPSRIYGDETLNQAYAAWSASGYPEPSGVGQYELEGKASWYGPGLNGNKTASGEIFDMYSMTAAHKKLPFGSIVLVTNQNNGKSVVVRINDRGPFIKGRIIDLSYGAAYLIEMVRAGVVPVTIEVIQLGKK
ncbi:MAG: septal ring lytic transglycosylase RlpA family protein [Proteobacteria bacterium]|jgi:rare lipoprotein A|nr:septal ring lytic transglycosylase RlpA family protein [Pseudomonadota bacterium]